MHKYPPVNATAFLAPAPNLNSKYPQIPDFYTRMCTLTEATYRNNSENSNKNLVIGAWGCGVFKNDPKNVAEMFKKIMPILQYDYNNIIVAIPDKNFLNIFKEVLTT